MPLNNYGVKDFIFLKNSLFQSKATNEPILGQEIGHKIGPDVVVDSEKADSMTETLALQPCYPKAFWAFRFPKMD